MDAFSAASVWVKGFNGRCSVCWRNRNTGKVVYSDPERRGLEDRPNPNSRQPFETFHGPREPAWQQYTDSTSGAKYWYDPVTITTTWTDPTITAIQQPPPPPPPEPEKKAENKPEKREQDQWFRINDPKKGRVWYNEKTEKKQDGRPQCLFKYR